jgi:hypothetical protein
MKSNFLVGIAAAGYVLFLGLALLPGLNELEPTGAWFAMSLCAVGAWLCGSGWQSWLALPGILIGIIGGIVCWQHNSWIFSEMRREQLPPPSATSTNR